MHLTREESQMPKRVTLWPTLYYSPVTPHKVGDAEPRGAVQSSGLCSVGRRTLCVVSRIAIQFMAEYPSDMLRN